MPNTTPEHPNLYTQREHALSRWDNEGGAGAERHQGGFKPDDTRADVPAQANSELAQLHVRVIALENLVIALLAGASDKQLEIAREMSTYISPRPGFTLHPMTIHAAHRMVDLVDRAGRFRVSDEAVTRVAQDLPYKRTPIFDETTLPAGLRREHRTKPGVWGVIRVLEGRVRYRLLDNENEAVLDPEHPGLVLPDQPHLVEPLGPMRMQIEFYDRMPEL